MSTRQLSNKQSTISHTERWKIHVLIFGIDIHKTTTQQKSKIPKKNPIKRTLGVLFYSAGRSVMCLDLCHF